MTATVRTPAPRVEIDHATLVSYGQNEKPQGAREVVIGSRDDGKGRSFRGYLLAHVRADALFPSAMTDTGEIVRPVYAVLAGSDSELRALVANLRLGREALFPDQRHGRRAKAGIELMRTAGYRFIWQQHPEGSVVLAYLPELFELDPGMVDPEGVRFVLLPSAAWVARQELPLEHVAAHITRLGYDVADSSLPWLVSTAYLFAAALDRRTRLPLFADGRFYAQVLLAALRVGLASWTLKESPYSWSGDDRFGRSGALRFVESGTPSVGLLPGVAFRATHDQVGTLLSDEVTTFFAMTGGR